MPRWTEFVKMIGQDLEGMEKPKQRDYEGHWAEASIRRVMDAGIMNAVIQDSRRTSRLHGQR